MNKWKANVHITFFFIELYKARQNIFSCVSKDTDTFILVDFIQDTADKKDYSTINANASKLLTFYAFLSVIDLITLFLPH